MGTTLFLVALCWREISSLTFTKEHRLRALVTRILRKPFGLKREEKAGEWKKLHNEEFHNCYTLPIITLVIK